MESSARNLPRNESKESDALLDLQASTDDPHISGNQALMNFFKGQVAAGILAMHVAVMNAGILLGTVGIFAFSVLATHCMHLLSRSSFLLRRDNGFGLLDFEHVAEAVCLSGSPRLQKYSTFMRKSVQFSLNFTQVGFCCVNLLFIAVNIKQVFEYYAPTVILPIQVYIFIFSVCLIPMAFAKNLNTIAPYSAAGNVLSVFCLLVIIIYLMQDLTPIWIFPAVAPAQTLPLFFGTVVFAFEGIGLVLPNKNKMLDPEDFVSWNGPLNTGMALTTILYVAIGFFGYLKYGSASVVITLNLPLNNMIFIIVRLLYSFTLYIGFSIQFYVPFKIMYPFIHRSILKYRCVRYGEYIFRSILLTVVFLITALVPYLELFIALLGALSSSALALIFPALFDLILARRYFSGAKLYCIVVKDILIIIFGFLGFLTGTIVSLIQIIEKISADF